MSKSDLGEIVKDGFVYEGHDNDDVGLAFISLRIALKSYFSTYAVFKDSIHYFTRKNSFSQKENIDQQHGDSYFEAFAETIVHFQHFSELACKKILKEEHPLLSDISSSDPIVLHKLIHGLSIKNDEDIKLRSIEFSEAIRRLFSLIKEKQISNHEELSILSQHKETLNQLNALRNRIWHRGIYLLRYPALDEFIGKFVLPFVKDILTLKLFSDHKKTWLYYPLHCDIDPVNEIVNEYKGENHRLDKVAFLKELGRAAYENPLIKTGDDQINGFLKIFNNKHKNRALRIANVEAKVGYSDLSICPVCGTEALVSYYDHEDNSQEPTDSYWHVYMVKCECCSLLLQGAVENPKEYGYTNISDFWRTE